MSAATSPCGIVDSRTNDLQRAIAGAVRDVAEAIRKAGGELIARPEEDAQAVSGNVIERLRP